MNRPEPHDQIGFLLRISQAFHVKDEAEGDLTDFSETPSYSYSRSLGLCGTRDVSIFARLIQSESQRHRSPACRCCGDPLVRSVREATLKIGLHGVGARLDKPRAIGKLRLEQACDALLVGLVTW